MAKKKKSRKVEEEYDDDDLVETADDDTEPESTGPQANLYVGLAALTLLALVLAATLFYLDHDELAAQSMPNPQVNIPALATPPQTR